MNQTLVLENGRLRTQFASQEEDRNFLIKQLVAGKFLEIACVTSFALLAVRSGDDFENI